MLRSTLILAVVFGGLVVFGNATHVGCPSIGNASVSQGWTDFRDGRLNKARERFDWAYRRCPAHLGALVGLGYVAFRQNRDEEAAAWFDRALAVRPDLVDALTGQGLLAWRADDLERAHELFSRVLQVEPGHREALAYLDALPPGLGEPPDRPPLTLPDTVEYPARTRGDGFEVLTADGWQPFYVKGVNLGAALPGRHPSQFPDRSTYAEWLEGMVEMGANTVRVYTIHPPEFYEALHELNTARAHAPLRLIQGIWMEPPPNDDFDDPAWLAGVKAELRDALDAVHGRADIRPRPGHASGHYLADVSAWTLAFLLSREWEPYIVVPYTERNPERTDWTGRYLAVSGGNAMDVWLARMTDYLVAYETTTYGKQRPVAYSSWPTLDPLTHVTESTMAEDWAIRRALGEELGEPRGAFDEDAVGVDPSLVRTTDRFRAGYFAAYHVYPYAPDFLVLDPEYNQAVSPYGRSNYYGYLRDLKRHHAGMPLLVAEYGVPVSVGVSHVQPNGWHHGGHTEDEMARIGARLTREIAAAGAAGGIVFAWIDEWFKTNWLTGPYTLPVERNRFWRNRLDPEQHYGVMAMEPEPRLSAAGEAARLADWARVPALYEDAAGARLRALADEDALHLLFEAGDDALPDTLFVGFDTHDPDTGGFRWPGAVGPRVPVGVELVLVATPAGARLLAQPEALALRIEPDTVGAALRRGPVSPELDGPLPGLATGRFRQVPNERARTVRREDGRYDSLFVVTNRVRFARDSVEYAAIGYDRGVLREGPPPDGAWQRLGDRAVEVRIPWALLNVTDPSRRRVLVPGGLAAGDTPATRETDGIRIAAAWPGADGGWRALPRSGSAADVAIFSWDAWDEPRWRARRRPLFDALATAFQTLNPNLLTTDVVR